MGDDQFQSGEGMRLPFKPGPPEPTLRSLSNRWKFIFNDWGRVTCRGPSTKKSRYTGPGAKEKCTVDAFIYDHKFKGVVGRNVQYITRDSAAGQERDGEQRILGQEVIEGIQGWNSDDFHYMLVISPEKGNDLPIDKLAQDIVKDMEKDLGTKLEWCGAVHRNTAHAHVHLMIRGKDDNGHRLEIRTRYLHRVLKQVARERVTAIAARERGLLLTRERRKVLKREHERTRDKGKERGLML